MNKSELIRKIYLYLASFIGLILIVIGTVRLVDLGLKVYVFKDADTYVYYPGDIRTKPDGTTVELTSEEKEEMKKQQEEAQIKQTASQRQREASSSVAMLLVGLPVFFYHWKVVGKEK